MAIVYCYTNNINNKKYIGITTRTMKEREKSHLYEAYNENSGTYNTPFKRAIRKYGINGFNLDILHKDVTKEEALRLESEYIKEFRTYYKYKNGNGYNATIGGEYISNPKDRILKIDIYNKYSIKAVYESMSEAEKLEGQRLINFSNNKGNLSSNTKYIYMPEKDYDEETIEYDVLSKLKSSVVQLSMEGEFIKIWTNRKEAKNETKASNIALCLKGDRLSSGGYRWVKLDDYLNNIYTIKDAKDMKMIYIAIDLDGCYKGEFLGLEEVKNKTNASHTDVSKITKNQQENRVSGDYIWFLKEEYESLSKEDIAEVLKRNSVSDNRVIAFKDEKQLCFKNKVECGKYFGLSSVTIKIKIDKQERVKGWLLNNRNKFKAINKDEYISNKNTPSPKNQTGHKNISYRKDKGKYYIQKKHNGIFYRRYAKTLEEALIERAKLYSELGLSF